MARNEVEVEVSEFTRVHGSGSFADFAGNRDTSGVWLWDAGPERPLQPKRPAAPKGREGDPEYEILALEFRQELEFYADALQRYQAAKKEYANFERQYGGAFQVWFWSADAQDALNNDGRAVAEGRQSRRRYFISSRTRGYEALPNGGLPLTLKPGHGHEENLRREREGDAERAFVRKSDPVFGSEIR